MNVDDQISAPSRLPMALTLSRIAAGPLIAALIVWAAHLSFTDRWTAALIYACGFVLFALAALTDWLDGVLARKSGSVSTLGAALDHGADKVLTACVLVALAYAALPADLVIATILLLGRDIGIAALREGLSNAGKPLPVSQGGKVKTALLLAAILVILALQVAALVFAPAQIIDVLAWAGRVTLWVAAGLALWTGAGYLRDAFTPTSR